MKKSLELLFPKFKNVVKNPTGEWRTFRPEINYEKCTGCGICATYCPDELIEIFQKKGKKIPKIDYEYCKGCGICVEVCPVKSITFKREEIGLKRIGNISNLLEQVDKEDLIEIVWHGRGGQGVVTASELVATAVLYANKYSQSMPIFGPERAGAPVRVYTRISNKPIKIKSDVNNPDIAVFLDPSLLRTEAFKGMIKGGSVIINSPYAYKLEGVNVYYLDATKIALETLQRPIVSTAMASAVLRVSGLASLENLVEAVKGRFEEKIMEMNVEAVKRAYEEVKLFK